MKEKYTLQEDGFVGYWHPARGHEGKALIVFPGSGADYALTKSGSDYLEKAGWSRLLVAFAGWDGLPGDPVETPVEYAERAIQVLQEAGISKIGMTGISAGAKYAITAASYLPEVSLLAVSSPYDHTTEAFQGTKPLDKSTFTFRGKPLPYDPTVTLHRNLLSVLLRTACNKKYGPKRMLRGCYQENVPSEEARIKVEQMHADLLVQYPGYDDCWPSDEAVPRMQKILAQCKYPYRVQATCYEKGSHLLGAALPEDYRKQMRKILQAEAVDPAACEQAREESMREILAFLEGWE